MVEEPRGLSWLYIVIAVLLLVVLALMIPKFLYRMSCEFAVTTRRVIVKTGLVRVCSFELLLAKIEGIHVDQTFLGRLLDYGTVSISATGGSRNTYERISKPLEFRTRIQQQADEAQHRTDAAKD